MNNPNKNWRMDDASSRRKKRRRRKNPFFKAVLAIICFLAVLAVSLVIVFACEKTTVDENPNEPSIQEPSGENPPEQPTPDNPDQNGDSDAEQNGDGSNNNENNNGEQDNDTPENENGENEGSTEQTPEYLPTDCFITESDFKKVVFSSAGELVGELLDVYEEKGLCIVKVRSIDNYNRDVDTVKIFRLADGAILSEASVENERGVAVLKTISANFCDGCGMFIIKKTTLDNPETADIDETSVELSHYTSGDVPELLGVSDLQEHTCEKIGEVYAISLNARISFFDEEMNLLSDYNGDFLSVEDLSGLNAKTYIANQNEGYFYFFSDTEAVVFDISGNCTAKYTLSDTRAIEINPFVLNNGNVFIQYVRSLDATESKYDVALNGSKYDVVSVIVDHKNGNSKEVDCKFIVNDLSAAFEGNTDDFLFTLRDGFENQAYINRFSNGKLSTFADYAVIDNELKLTHSFPCNFENVVYSEAFAIDGSHIVAEVILSQNTSQLHLFDSNGKVIAAFPGGAAKVTESFIVSEKTVYDHNMSVVYNFAKERFVLEGVCGDTVYLSRYNEATESEEFYVYKNGAAEPTLVFDGIGAGGYLEITDSYCIFEDAKGVKTLYNYNGEAISSTDGIMQVKVCNGALIVSNTVEGVTRNFVITSV